MAAYVIVDIEVTDAAAYQEYVGGTPATVEAYDGRFLVRGGATDILEGEWTPNRVVVIEFPSVERARQWLDSPEYSAIKGIRHRTARTNMIVVEGVLNWGTTVASESQPGGIPMSDNQSFIALMDRKARRTWDAIFELPFLVELSKGTLPLESFKYFLREDRLYLERFSKALALGSVHADDLDVRAFFLQRSGLAMGSEEGFHTGFAGRLGLDLAEVSAGEPAPITVAYTDHLLRVAQVGPLGELLAACLPCYLVYKRAGQHLAALPMPDHEVYSAWIQAYARPEFAAAVQRQCDLGDKLWLQADERIRGRMELWFDRSLRYEWMFWDQAYRRLDWPSEVASDPVATRD